MTDDALVFIILVGKQASYVFLLKDTNKCITGIDLLILKLVSENSDNPNEQNSENSTFFC